MADNSSGTGSFRQSHPENAPKSGDERASGPSATDVTGAQSAAELLAHVLGMPKRGPNRPTATLDPVEIIARAARPASGQNVPPSDPVAIIAASVSPMGWTHPLERAPAPPPHHQPAGTTPQPQDLQDTFWQVWMEHQNYLQRHSLRLMAGNKADAEDAMSNAMLKALQKFSTYAGAIVNERAWLTRLVHNVCMDIHRSNSKIARSLEESVGDDFETLASTLVSDSASPEENVATQRSMDDLSTQLDRMPESLREPLLLRFLDDLSYDEIAARLNLSNCAVRKRIQLARDFLRKSGIR